MKKIIIISNTASSLLNFRKHFIIYLVKCEYEVFGLAVDFTDETKRDLLKLGATPVDYQLARGGLNPFADLLNTLKLSRIIKKIAPDIVFSTFVKPAIFGTLAAKAVGVKFVVAMLEGLGFYFTEQPEGIRWKTKVLMRIQILLYKISLPRADRVIFLNHDDPIDLLKKNKIRVKDFKVLEGIGLSMDEFKFVPPMTSNSVRFIFVGRLLKEKGIFEFLEAAGLVKDKYEGAQFYVLGATDNENPGAIKEEKLKEYIDRGVIDYPGQVKNINEWLTKSHVFVLPSYREGLPRSTQEAMAVGRAVITTDVPGCRETVVNNRNGFIVSKGSAIELADKMSYFIEHPDEITRMGLESYVIANEKYNVEFINEKLLNWLQN